MPERNIRYSFMISRAGVGKRDIDVVEPPEIEQ